MAGLVLKCMGTMGVLLFKVWWVGISDTIELEDFFEESLQSPCARTRTDWTVWAMCVMLVFCLRISLDKHEECRGSWWTKQRGLSKE